MKRSGVRLQLIQQPLLTTTALEDGAGMSIFTGGVPGGHGAQLWLGLGSVQPQGWHCLFYCSSPIRSLAKMGGGGSMLYVMGGCFGENFDCSTERISSGDMPFDGSRSFDFRETKCRMNINTCRI